MQAKKHFAGFALMHFLTICIHKAYVFHYCRIAGISWQGVLHDLSKFSPAEFLSGARWYENGQSPIKACKEKRGISTAWLHHRGRNKHHYEYWVDDFDKGTRKLAMPYRYALEMICDWIGAARAYGHGRICYKQEYLWWKERVRKGPPAMLEIHAQMPESCDSFSIRHLFHFS